MMNHVEAYPFLSEKGVLCDYEVETDLLASLIGSIRNQVQAIDPCDIETLCQLVYHANGSVRGQCAIDEKEVNFLYHLQEKYPNTCRQFVLPTGCASACSLHLARSLTKRVIRILYRVRQENKEVPETLFEFFNILSNLFFAMALFENQKNGVQEISFVSRSYRV